MGAGYLGFIYGKAHRFVKSFSGCVRYNVLGAVDFVTKEVVTVTNDAYITAIEVCEILRMVSAKYAGKDIHIVLDNARYQKCGSIQNLAMEPCVGQAHLQTTRIRYQSFLQ